MLTQVMSHFSAVFLHARLSPVPVPLHIYLERTTKLERATEKMFKQRHLKPPVHTLKVRNRLVNRKQIHYLSYNRSSCREMICKVYVVVTAVL